MIKSKIEIKLLDKVSSLMPKFDEKNSKYIIVGIILGILIVNYGTVTHWQLASLRKLNPKVSILLEDIKKAENDIQMQENYRREVLQLKEEIGRLNKKIKSKSEVPLVLENLSRVANKQGVTIDQIMPVSEGQQSLLKEKAREYFSVPITISATSTYHDFGRFLNAIEFEDMGLNLRQFSIKSGSLNSLKHSIKLTLETIIFEDKEK